VSLDNPPTLGRAPGLLSGIPDVHPRGDRPAQAPGGGRAQDGDAARAALEARCATLPPPRDFERALAPAPGRAPSRGPSVKKASPSRGVLKADLDPVSLATTYARHCVDAISVLTDAKYFSGSLDDLRAVRAAVDAPLLRKDFTLDEYQLWEARAAGADAILLIVAMLEPERLRDLARPPRGSASRAGRVSPHLRPSWTSRWPPARASSGSTPRPGDVRDADRDDAGACCRRSRRDPLS